MELEASVRSGAENEKRILEYLKNPQAVLDQLELLPMGEFGEGVRVREPIKRSQLMTVYTGKIEEPG